VFVIKPIGKKKKSIFYYVPTLLPGLIIFLVVVIPTVVGQYFVPPSQLRVMADAPNLPPSTKHILGTQSEGRDVFALLLKGTPGTLSMGVIGGLVGLTVGTCLGLISGYAGGKVDTVIRLLVDVALTIPSLALLIMIAATFRGLSLLMMGVVLALTSWMQSTRVIRSQVLSLRERNFIKMAKLSGMSDLYIVFREILPNLLPFVVAAFVDAVSTAILASIGLEILGLGSQQNQTLGNTIYYAIYYSAMWRGLWWWWLPPVIILVMIFLSLFLLSVSLDQYSNPRLQRAG
jgi:peptide/nickel transport system permease protein